RYAYLPGKTNLVTAAVPPSVLNGQAKTGIIGEDFNVYSIAGVTGGSIVLSAGNTNNHSNFEPYSAAMQTRVQLFGPAGQPLGNELAPNIQGVFGGYGGVATLTAVNLPATGIYYAVVSSGDGDTGTYSFAAAS